MSAGVAGLPGLCLPHRRALQVTSWRCQPSTVSGRTRKQATGRAGAADSGGENHAVLRSETGISTSLASLLRSPENDGTDKHEADEAGERYQSIILLSGSNGQGDDT
jgi:hypothetical protein